MYNEKSIRYIIKRILELNRENLLIKRILYRLRGIYNLQRDHLFHKRIVKESNFSAPDFLIIGAAKAGTTSLFQYLCQHPSILPPKEKEIGYFSFKLTKGLKWYLNCFPPKNVKRKKLTFEATPTYLYLKRTPKEVARFFPNIKLIVILRDPVKRAFSHWSFYQNSSFVEERSDLKDKRSFKKAVYEEFNCPEIIPLKHKYIERGLYADQLQNWYSYFSAKQILVLDSEELKQHPKSILRKITNFLNIPPYYSNFKNSSEQRKEFSKVPKKESVKRLIKYNVTSYKKDLDKEVERKLREFYKPEDKKLRELTGITFSWMN